MSKLERIIHDDSNGLDYILVGEIYLPLITVPEEKREIGFLPGMYFIYVLFKDGCCSYYFCLYPSRNVPIRRIASLKTSACGSMTIRK